jgi:hypothetical protein
MFHVLQVLVPTKMMLEFRLQIGTCRSDRINKQISSLSDILIKLKTEFNAIGSGNWE